MRRIRFTFWGLLTGTALLWWLAESTQPTVQGFFAQRALALQLTGLIAIVAMSAAMLLATRPRWLERPLSGLDKMYRLHKWLGEAALVAALLHWLCAQGPRWMIGLGWLERPARRAPPLQDQISPMLQTLRSLRGPAEMLGEWGFYAAALLMAMALIRRVPYRRFAQTHRLLAPLYLALAFHSAVLLKIAYWAHPLGPLLALCLIAGTWAAALSIARRIGWRRRVTGTVSQTTDYPELRVLETEIRLDEGWPGHAPGQFAFVTADAQEGAHPYTIASAWSANRRIVFITKALGDHTATLPQRLKPGAPVQVEGPYGCFTFDDTHPRQIWVGAGIGITAFIGRLKHLARTPGTAQIDLFHTTADYAQAAIDKLSADARAAGVKLHLKVDARDGLLNGAQIRAAVPDWRSASVWFCGPAAFGEALRRDFLAQGLAPADFHQELFELR